MLVSSPRKIEKIPGPRPLPIFGHIAWIDTRRPVTSLLTLTRKFADICRIRTPGQNLILLKSQRLASEVMNEVHFEKHVHNVLRQMRPYAGSGLFIAETRSPQWADAHKALAPGFAMSQVTENFELIRTTVDRWIQRIRTANDEVIDINEEMTRIAIDVIGRSAFSFDFASVQGSGLHPFLLAMAENLKISGYRARRPSIVTALKLRENKFFAQNTETMMAFARMILDQRLSTPKRQDQAVDLLDRLLNGFDHEKRDPEKLKEICHQIVTLLISGHETTGALISFALQALARHPEVYRRLQSEIDGATGQVELKIEHIKSMPYLDQVLKECLRLWPPVPTFARRSKGHSETLGGRYRMSQKDVFLVMLPAVHRDRAIWGADADEFRPERMHGDLMMKLPKGSYLPFGIGKRICIGSNLALLEASVVLTRILQSYEISLESDYQMKIAETPGFRPEGLKLRFRERRPVATIERITAPPNQGTCPYGH